MDDNEYDYIYEAALLPELWPHTLQRIASATSSEIGLVFCARGVDDFSVVTNPGQDHILEEYNRLNLFERSMRMPRMLARPYSGFIGDEQIFTEDERKRDPAYTEFFWPRGWGHSAATAIRLPDDQTVIIDFERTLKQGTYVGAGLDYFDRLRPHFGRASILMAKMEREKANARVAALEAVGLSAAILDRQGRIMAANSPFQSLIPAVFVDFQERLKLLDAGADSVLAALLQKKSDKSCSIPIMAIDGRPCMVAHVLPIKRNARDLFSVASYIIVVLAITKSPEVLTSSVVEMLFDLTPSESEVARAIASGKTLEEIAQATNRSRETVRTYLKWIFAKTGVKRQSELISLLTSGALPNNSQTSRR